MSAVGKKRGRRYGRESQQEDRSEGQIKDRFAELGWPCDRLGRDLGEDLHVRIFDDGDSTGLSFQVQLKSAADAERLRRKKSPALAYRLDVKDLLHWEVATTLVVLVVWDVEKREGWWRPVSEIIKELDEAEKGWRKKKTATVTVPLANTTDVEGMQRLRWAVADHNLPIVPKSDMEFSLTFDMSDEGKAALKAFEEALDTGESVTFEQGFVPTVEFPSWHRRIYGAYRGQPSKLEIRPRPSQSATAVRVEVTSSEGSASFSYVELRAMLQGRKRLVLTNEHQKLPVVFTLDLNGENPRFKFRQTDAWTSVYEARDAAAFMLAAAGAEGMIRVIRLDDGEVLLPLETSRGTRSHDLTAMRSWRDTLDKVCFIQQRVAAYGIITQEALRGITTAELDVVSWLVQVFRDGKADVVKSVSFQVTPTEERLPEEDCAVCISLKGFRVKVLGLDIPLGDVRATIVDSETFLRTVRGAHAQARLTGKAVPVRMKDMHIVEEYLDWLPGHLPWAAMYEALDCLAKTAGPRSGYFTRRDAFAAGASESVLPALLDEHKIKAIAPDVYHLVQFPHADREDLVVLWLQTDRRGVISHETALFLHDLCDILPSRLHITVPPDWSPQDQQFAANVKIRHGDVPEEDLRWLGAVPYTAPLRTLRDCIEVGVSPELIEQAIAEGIRRGLFTEADFSPSVRAESA